MAAILALEFFGRLAECVESLRRFAAETCGAKGSLAGGQVPGAEAPGCIPRPLRGGEAFAGPMLQLIFNV